MATLETQHNSIWLYREMDIHYSISEMYTYNNPDRQCASHHISSCKETPFLETENFGVLLLVQRGQNYS